jgi:NitT/TauT family transport system ATP-binding protein
VVIPLAHDPGIAMTNQLIEIEKVSFSYGDRKIIDSANLSINQNSIVSIMGPSGCGKSTLLRIISGLEEPTGGFCRFDGEEVRRPPKTLRYSFQDYDAFPWRTVEKNLSLFARRVQQKNTDPVTELLQKVGLQEHREKFPLQLSGGMRKRLALGRCIAGAPKAILLDEPFSSLDVSSRDELHKLVLNLAQETGCTFVVVTHDIDEAVFLSSRVIVSDPLPFHVRKVIEIPFHYPRSTEIRQTHDFEQLCEEIRSLQIHSDDTTQLHI